MYAENLAEELTIHVSLVATLIVTVKITPPELKTLAQVKTLTH